MTIYVPPESSQVMKEMARAIVAVALEVPAEVHKDVRERWNAVVGLITQYEAVVAAARVALDWLERGDQDSNDVLYERFRLDKMRLRAALDALPRDGAA